ncbi:MAG TPA: hypothetical protein VHB51_01220 [Candidatus Saccharimonadales bacterium]|nr:hypothetical protein [Candidatus Saccharimonadales bacterium]
MALTTTSGGGTQQNTDSPQNSTSGGNFGGQKASAVQPGTATNLLNGGAGTTGVPLVNTPVTRVSLSSAGSHTQAAVSTPKHAPTHHHVNPALLGIVAVVFVAAFVMFWSIAQSAKNTTDY